MFQVNNLYERFRSQESRIMHTNLHRHHEHFCTLSGYFVKLFIPVFRFISQSQQYKSVAHFRISRWTFVGCALSIELPSATHFGDLRKKKKRISALNLIECFDCENVSRNIYFLAFFLVLATKSFQK